MTRQVVLTDDALRRALTPDGRGASSELLASIAEEVARTPQRPGVLAWRPWMAGAARGRGTWVLVAAAAMLVLLAGLLLATGGRPQPIFRSPLVLPPLVLDIHYNVRFLAVGREEAWVADHDGRLWHGTAAGWIGPELTPGPGIRALALLSDGRLVVTGDLGTQVREPAGDWRVLGTAGSNGVAVDSSGAIWATESQDLVAGLARYAEQAGGWERTWIDCPAGGLFVAAATDGAVWTGGFAYAMRAGLARFDGTRCDEVFVFDAGRRDVYDLAAGPNREVVARLGPPDDDPWAGGPGTVLWDGSTWRTLSSSSDPIEEELAIGPDGAVYGAGDGRIRRYRDGRWETVVDPVTFSDEPAFARGVLATAPDGTLWYATWRSDHSLSVERVPTADQPD